MTAPQPVSVGIVGAGPWATMVHAPVFAAGPETRLAGVWARRRDAAVELAARYHAPVAASPEDLFARCDAVVFAVPPGVQAELAVLAVRAGKAVILEKPIAAHIDGAEKLARAIADAGVPSLVVLSWRYAAEVRSFLEAAAGFGAFGGTGRFISGGLLNGPFSTPWRLERGPLLDLGPHVVDLLDAALGPVTAVHAHGDLHAWIGLTLEHRAGAVSQASLCASSAIDPPRMAVELWGPSGLLEVDCAAAVGPAAYATLRREVADAVRGGHGHPLDVRRGLHLQRILHDAEQQLQVEPGPAQT